MLSVGHTTLQRLGTNWPETVMQVMALSELRMHEKPQVHGRRLSFRALGGRNASNKRLFRPNPSQAPFIAGYIV